MSVRSGNLKKRRLTCLRCGKLFWTDRCHRICKSCCMEGQEPFVRSAVTAEGLMLLDDHRFAEELPITDEMADEEELETCAGERAQGSTE